MPLISFANDAAYYGDGADVYPLEHSEIQLVTETIIITDTWAMNTNKTKNDILRWHVKVDMTFKNHGKSTTVQMGFPIHVESFDDAEKVNLNFTTWVNGKKLPIVKKHGISNPLKETNQDFPADVFTYEVSFKKGEIKKIVHEYSVGGYFSAAGDWEFSYILRTGALWKDAIEKLSIYYKTNTMRARDLLCIEPREHTSKKENEELMLSWHFKIYEPSTDLHISGGRGVVYKGSIDDLIHSNKKYLMRASPCSLRYIRNRIFALYGYQFKSPYIRSLFYFSGSPYKENPSYSINKLSPKHLAFLDYLSKIEIWGTKIQERREVGIFNDEHLQIKFDSGIVKPLMVDHKNNRFLTHIGKDLIFVSLEEFLPVKKIALPKLKRRMKNYLIYENDVVKSQDNKYIAVRVKYPESAIIFIGLDEMKILGSIKNALDFQFSRNSTFLYTNHASYNLLTGKKNDWLFPEYNLMNKAYFTMVFGILKNNNLLFTVNNYSSTMKPILFDIKKNQFITAEGIIKGTSKYVRTNFYGRINLKGDLLAGVIKTTDPRLPKNETKLTFKIWRIVENLFEPIYEKSINGNSVSFFKIRWVKDSLFIVEGGKLWRYDFKTANINKTLIPLEGYRDGIVDKLENSFVCSYLRCWDIETGKKITPWYEMLDPFDKSNQLPLYEEKPSPVNLKDFW